MNNSDMPAMPYTEYDKDGNLPTGLTKREHFAGLAMQGLLAGNPNNLTLNDVADIATDQADALLAALEQEQAK